MSFAHRCLISLTFSGTALLAQSEQIRWKISVAQDRSYSFHYPDRWAAAPNAGGAILRNDPGGEQMVVLRMPREGNMKPSEYVEQVAAAFRKTDPNFNLSDLKEAGRNAVFRIQYGQGYTGLGVLTLHPPAAFWVTYGSQNQANMNRGGALLTAISQSIADNASSPAPAPLTVEVAHPGNGPQVTSNSPLSPPSIPVPTGGNVLIGNWSTVAYYGDLVNRQTGLPVQSVYNGQWYTFRTDGTYHYAMAGSGKFISGVSMADGRWELRGAQLMLHQRTSSWYPFAQSARQYPRQDEHPDPKEIVLGVQHKSATEVLLQPPQQGYPDTFHRQPNQ